MAENFERELRQMASESEPSERLSRLLDIYYDRLMERSPEWATQTGYEKYTDGWSDPTPDCRKRKLADARLLGETLEGIDPDKLGVQERLSYDLLQRQSQLDIDEGRFPYEMFPISQMHGIQQDAARILGMMPTRTVDQRGDILARLEKLPRVVDDVRTQLQAAAADDYTLPRVAAKEIPQQVLNQIPEAPEESSLLSFLGNLPVTLEESQRQRIRQDAVTLYQDHIRPAFAVLHDTVAEEYLPACRESIAWSDLPDGEAWYAHLVAEHTTTEMTPEEIFQIGQSEVRRIRGEMDRVIAEAGFEGDFDAFCEFLRTDSRFFFDSKEELLREYRDICKRIDPELAGLFRRLPQLPYGVIPIPTYSEKNETTAYYQPGSLKAGRAGYFYANTYDLKSRPKWEMEALSLHEAVPGHHLHIALQQELEYLPVWRQQNWITAFGEGWALYAESLGEQMGFFQDAYAKFGQLTYEMWRAIRLVVDPAMHSKGWSREKAIEFFRKNSSKTAHDIQVEIDRYIVWPGQALAYKIGELKIKELRRLAEETLAGRFDIRAFHDELLRYGCVPLTVLERLMKAWVAEQKE